MRQIDWSERPYLRWLTLFITSSTLLCCAFPIVLVSLGFGAMVANLFYAIPGLVVLAEHKIWTMCLSALLLVFLAWVIWRPNQCCPADPEKEIHCRKAKHWNQRIFWISVVIWSIGVFFGVFLLPLREFFEI